MHFALLGKPFIKPMANKTATASKSMFLPCYVAGYPIESIHWTRGGNIFFHCHLISQIDILLKSIIGIGKHIISY